MWLLIGWLSGGRGVVGWVVEWVWLLIGWLSGGRGVVDWVVEWLSDGVVGVNGWLVC